MNPQSPLEQEKPEGRPENARRLFILISVLAAFGLLGGVWSIKTSIEQPLAFTNTPAIKNQLTSSSNTSENDAYKLAALKDKDADQDGLSDYDELYTYGSSPYIQDSDSDGISDKDEVDNGTDPNCPEGTECTAIAVFTPDTNTNSITNTSTNSTNSTSTTNTNPAAASLNVDELRAALKNAGMAQSDLDALSDEQLKSLYSEVLAEDSNSNSSSTNATNTGGDSTSISYEDLSNLTVAEIRQLLILGGADEATLDEMDDNTLKAIFNESIQNLELSNTNE
ncbi:MAG: thrombospondin type 3 repeat-containing protein [Patescibacteria group bacterium]